MRRELLAMTGALGRGLLGNFRISLVKTLAFGIKARTYRVRVARNFKVVNSGRISYVAESRIRFGTVFFGFLIGNESSLIRNRGELCFEGDVSVADSNYWDIGPGARMTVGSGTSFSPGVKIVISEGLRLGDKCAVGWDTQILDTDFHRHGAVGQIAVEVPTGQIVIGNHVWVGSGVKIMKGIEIADDCIVAAGSLVTRSFVRKGSLIGGVPAKVIRDGYAWE